MVRSNVVEVRILRQKHVEVELPYRDLVDVKEPLGTLLLCVGGSHAGTGWFYGFGVLVSFMRVR